jgi:hypothetical protein
VISLLEQVGKFLEKHRLSLTATEAANGFDGFFLYLSVTVVEQLCGRSEERRIIQVPHSSKCGAQRLGHEMLVHLIIVLLVLHMGSNVQLPAVPEMFLTSVLPPRSYAPLQRVSGVLRFSMERPAFLKALASLKIPGSQRPASSLLMSVLISRISLSRTVEILSHERADAGRKLDDLGVTAGCHLGSEGCCREKVSHFIPVRRVHRMLRS